MCVVFLNFVLWTIQLDASSWCLNCNLTKIIEYIKLCIVAIKNNVYFIYLILSDSRTISLYYWIFSYYFILIITNINE